MRNGRLSGKLNGGIGFAAGGWREKELFGHGSVLGAGWLTEGNYTGSWLFGLVSGGLK